MKKQRTCGECDFMINKSNYNDGSGVYCGWCSIEFSSVDSDWDACDCFDDNIVN